MPITKHKDYEIETKRLEDTKEYLENVIYTLMESRVKFKEEIKDAYIHLDFLDSSLSYSSIMMNSKLLDNLEKNFDLLMRSRTKPYFSRIDIKHPDKNHTEKLYIGKVSLFDSEMETPLVVDWRAPIASVYYDGRLGETTYVADGVEQTIDLLMKRQYIIEDGQLDNFMDVDISATDTFLQASLGAHAGEKLKDIVSTIQAEQNAIIRADINKPLIVQGVAGSGKTTIALHRIAYLIYTFSETFLPHNFMIIAPNSLFLDYISQVLPELGADKVKQTTFVDFMLKLIGKKMKLENSNHKLLTLINSHDDSVDKRLLERAAQFKNSMNMKDIIENYVNDILMNLLPEEDFSLNEKVLLTNDEIKKMVYDELSFLPIFRRIDKLKIYLNKTVRSEAKKVLSKLSDQYDKQIEDVMSRVHDPEARRSQIVELMAEKDENLKQIEKDAKNVTNRFINKIKRKDLITYYETLISDSGLLRKYCDAPADGLVLDFVAKASKEIFLKKHVEIEDFAAMVYLQKFLFGIDDDLDIRYVVIDEAQDFSEFQFFVLRNVLKTDRFTILGDLSQGIHGYRSLNSWECLKRRIFTEEASYLTLEQSYRTTVEIMNFANQILKQSTRENIIFAKPVVRHGAAPNVVKCIKKNEVIEAVEAQIRQHKENGFTTIAVISKTEHEAHIMHKKLFKTGEFSVTLMDEKVTHYNNDIVVIPSHLAKGLEFDAVIVFTLDEEYGLEELDIKLLYVAMTRPLHRLSVIHMSGSMPIIENLKENNINVM